MRLALALLMPAFLAGMTGCIDTARSVGQAVAGEHHEIAIDRWTLQPREPVLIDGKRYEMFGIDRCASIGPFSSDAHDCITLSADRKLVPVMLKGADRFGREMLVVAYDDGKFKIHTLQGVPVIPATR